MSDVWSLDILDNAGIIDYDFGGHFWFYNGYDEDADFRPRFTSPHVNILTGEQLDRVNARMKNLLRLASAIAILTSFQQDIFVPYRSPYCGLTIADDGNNVDIIIEEMHNPFDAKVLSEIKEINSATPESTTTQDYVQLAIEFPLVRETLLLLALSEEQSLYLIINISKIFENIRADIGASVDDIKRNKNKTIPEDLLSRLREILSYTDYFNNKSKSGFFSRHGVKESNRESDTITPPPFDNLRRAIQSLINCWLIQKCEKIFQRSYSIEHLDSMFRSKESVTSDWDL